MQDIRLTTVTLGALDPVSLARFYARLLNWELGPSGDGTWVAVRNPEGGIGIACQLEKQHARPVWPGKAGDQQMQVHLEIQVPDLQAGLRHALQCGARMAPTQPQADVRVCIDPAGHPFCLWVES
ncbi:VOC family protein [Micropruina sp.]|uniref:VOC family protein n=1 Tax=Micropruina sp. TaxID=2737536 RepID=UPI0039E41E24